MRHNIFDSMPSNIVSGKDNVFANFLQTAELYEFMKIDEDNIGFWVEIQNLMDLHREKVFVSK